MTAGRGWIALALVVFAAWRPWRLLLGAYLFGGVTILQLYSPGAGRSTCRAQLLSMLPYIATIVVLVIISRDAVQVRLERARLPRQAVPRRGLTRSANLGCDRVGERT